MRKDNLNHSDDRYLPACMGATLNGGATWSILQCVLMYIVVSSLQWIGHSEIPALGCGNVQFS